MNRTVNRKVNILKLFIIGMLFTAGLSAQVDDKNGGSIYSLFGIGDLNYSASNRTDAMGIMGIGLYGNYTNSINPAAWTRIQSTIFTSEFNFENIKSTDGTSTAKRTYGNFEGFDISIPLNKGNGWIFDLGLNAYSVVNYDAQFKGSVDGEEYTQTYSGNGGLNRLSAGFSYVVFRHFSIGAQFNYMFGNINKQLAINFTNGTLFDTRNSSSNTITGFYFNTGFIFHGFGKVFKSKKLDDMTLGAVFSTSGQFNSDISGRFNRSVSSTDSISLSTGDVELPLAFGVGISNRFNKKFTVAADVYFQQWDKFTYYGTHPETIKNTLKAGIGFEYTASERLEEPVYKRISYRLGASYTQDYLRINGENINSMAFSAGISLPISSYNAVDIYFKYIMRGKDTNGLIKDDIFRLGASVKIGELWFLKPSGDF